MQEDIDLWMTAAAVDDDRAAFVQVVEASQHLLRSMLLRETADPELADEIAQDTFVRAWAQRRQYRPGTSPRSWLLSIARSQLMEHYRHIDRDRRHVRELIRQELLRHADTADAEEGRKERLDALRVCLDGVGEDARRLLDLIHNNGLSTEDAARSLDIQPAACRQRLSRIQRSLRRCAETRMGNE
jgi:RNA polymerase sigma-70 factor, ECF subfamily